MSMNVTLSPKDFQVGNKQKVNEVKEKQQTDKRIFVELFDQFANVSFLSKKQAEELKEENEK